MKPVINNPRLVRAGMSQTAGPSAVYVVNGTTSTVPQYGILQISHAVDLSNIDRPVYAGVAPVFSSFNKKLVVTLEGIIPGGTGKCATHGLVPVNIYSEFDPDPVFCHVARASPTERLEAFHNQNNFGFPILYRANGTGLKAGVIRLVHHDLPGVIAISGGGMSPSIVLPNTSGSVTIPAPVDCWLADPTWIKFAKNTTVDVQNTDTGLRISGPSTWRGVLQVHAYFFIRSFRSMVDFGFPPGTVQWGSVNCRLKLRHYSDVAIDTGLITTEWVQVAGPPLGGANLSYGIISSGDTLEVHPPPVSIPFVLQTRPGDKISRLVLSVIHFGAVQFAESNPRNAQMAIGRWSLEMHEVNPLYHNGAVIEQPTGGSSGGASMPGFVFGLGGESFGDNSEIGDNDIDPNADAPEVVIVDGQSGDIPIDSGSGTIPA